MVSAAVCDEQLLGVRRFQFVQVGGPLDFSQLQGLASDFVQGRAAEKRVLRVELLISGR